MKLKYLFLLMILWVNRILANDTISISAKEKEQRWNIHFQTTVVGQFKTKMKVPYTGTNSLTRNREFKTSLTGTVFFGLRMWKHAELYINPEISGGEGLSGAVGIAGFTNGEIVKVGNPKPMVYLARAYWVQQIPIGKNKQYELADNDANQLRTKQYKQSFNIIAGKFGLTDFFDNIDYSNDPRTKFLNWSLMSAGAWDYAADVRGYTLSLLTQYVNNTWDAKFAIALLPKIANGAKLEYNIRKALSYNAELIKSFTIKQQAAKIGLCLYLNSANMGNYKTAINNYIQQHDSIPDITTTRALHRKKAGFSLYYQQAINNNCGVFTRVSWSDGKNETWAFTEIDHSLSFGSQCMGTKWKRPNDYIGAAYVLNGISKEHRQYLADGGYGFIIGDGKLRYGMEHIIEMYYNLQIKKYISIMGDYQLVVHPAYNKDRGPVNVFSLRLHVSI